MASNNEGGETSEVITFWFNREIRYSPVSATSGCGHTPVAWKYAFRSPIVNPPAYILVSEALDTPFNPAEETYMKWRKQT